MSVEAMIGIAALVGSMLGSGGVLGVLAFFIRRWTEKVDARLDRYEQDSKNCAVNFLSMFRTKDEALRAWEQGRKEQDDQWTKINDHDRRLTRLETVCEREHGK